MQFFITITLNPAQFRHTAKQQYDNSVNVVEALLNAFLHCDLLVCELTKGSNVHFHCIGTARAHVSETELRYELNNMKRGSKIIGFICVEQLLDYDKCESYCLKEVNMTSYLLGRPSVIIEPKKSIKSSVEYAVGSAHPDYSGLTPSNMLDQVEWLEDPLYSN